MTDPAIAARARPTLIDPERTPAPDAPRTRPELREIARPSALAGSPKRAAMLTYSIAATEFKLRFYGSAFGYLWQLLRPLLKFATLYMVFSHVVRVGERVEHYPVVLLMNLVLYAFFREGASAVTSLVDREQLIRKIQVPRIAIPLSVTLAATFTAFLNVAVVIVFAVANGIQPRWSWLEAPLLLAALALYAAGWAMLLSALYVRYRDVQPIWDVFAQILMYATPVIYVLDGVHRVSETAKHLLAMNPLASILIQMRRAVIDPSAPSAAEAAGSALHLLVPLLIGAFVVFGGYRVFAAGAARVAEDL